MLSCLYTDVVTLDPNLKFSQSFDCTFPTGPRFAALACGPVIGFGQVWDSLDLGSIRAGLAKNHAAQVPDEEWDLHIGFDAQRYARAEAEGVYDALGEGVLYKGSLLSTPEVVLTASWAPSKCKRYMDAFVDFIRSGTSLINRRQAALLKVKVEMLKAGKPPRVIHDFDSGETVLAHSWAMVLEKFIRTRLSWKGLKTRDKWKPLATAVAHFSNDCYIVCLDDVARDCNTITPDFWALTWFLEYIGVDMHREGHFSRLMRLGIKLFTPFGVVVSPLRRLFSGASYTSGMNWCTSRFLWYRLRRWLLLKRTDIIVICEGDDNIAIIRGSAYRSRKLGSVLTDKWVERAGRRCGKVLKVEAMGWFGPGTAWPAVGGKIVFHQGDWCFLPDYSRAIIKAGWAINYDWQSFSVMAGRVTARSWALNERFDGVPLFWAYARVVAAYAVTLGADPIFESDELFAKDEAEWDGSLAGPPTDACREAYALAYGVGVGNQLLLEQLLHDCAAAGDFTRDLTVEFRDLARPE